jgi:hypothetical protein
MLSSTRIGVLASLFAASTALAGAQDAEPSTTAEQPFRASLLVAPGHNPRDGATLTPGFALDIPIGARWALRPHLGFGVSSGSLTNLTLGATGLFTLHPGRTWRPYIGGGLFISHRSNIQFNSFPDRPGETVFTLEAKTGLERRLTQHLAVFAEVGVAATPQSRYLTLESLDGEVGWTKQRRLWDAAVPAHSGVGVSFMW